MSTKGDARLQQIELLPNQKKTYAIFITQTNIQRIMYVAYKLMYSTDMYCTRKLTYTVLYSILYRTVLLAIL